MVAVLQAMLAVCRGIKMEFKGITKREEGRFITRYDVEYETVDGKQKIYEMISRSDDITD